MMMNKAEDKTTADDGGDGRGGKGGKGEEFHVNSPFSPPPEQTKEESSKEEDAFKTPSPTSNRFVGTENTATTTTTTTSSNSNRLSIAALARRVTVQFIKRITAPFSLPV